MGRPSARNIHALLVWWSGRTQLQQQCVIYGRKPVSDKRYVCRDCFELCSPDKVRSQRAMGFPKLWSQVLWIRAPYSRGEKVPRGTHAPSQLNHYPYQGTREEHPGGRRR